MKSIAPSSGISKFAIFQEVEWPSTGGVDMDALPTTPVGVPLSKIHEVRPAKTWKTWDNTMEIRTRDSRIAVRGTLDEIVHKLNAPATPDKGTLKPFALTAREEQLHRMRQDGYSLTDRALALDMTPLAVAMADSKIEKKLEASHSEVTRRAPDKRHSRSASAYRSNCGAGRETAALMRDPNIHPDATT